MKIPGAPKSRSSTLSGTPASLPITPKDGPSAVPEIGDASSSVKRQRRASVSANPRGPPTTSPSASTLPIAPTTEEN